MGNALSIYGKAGGMSEADVTAKIAEHAALPFIHRHV